jgi:DNA-binding transcriptional ArsR family regulator
MLHVLAVPGHHPSLQGWAARTREALPDELAARLAGSAFLWRSFRADFLLPGKPRETLAEELDGLDRLDERSYLAGALVMSCGADPGAAGSSAGLARAVELARARGPLQADFADRLVADPPAVRAEIRQLLADCGPAFFDATWQRVRPRLLADLRVKQDLLARHGLAETLAAVSRSILVEDSADGARRRLVIDKLQDNATTAVGTGLTLIPSVFGHPHLVAMHARGRRPVLQYPAAAPGLPEPVPLDQVTQRLQALAHPVRLRLARTLARGPHTTGELAAAWELTAPEVSRHLGVLRRAALLTTRRRGRYVLYELDPATTTALGADLLDALLR